MIHPLRSEMSLNKPNKTDVGEAALKQRGMPL